jgi:hypothetical protein
VTVGGDLSNGSVFAPLLVVTTSTTSVVDMAPHCLVFFSAWVGNLLLGWFPGLLEMPAVSC